MTGDQIHYRKGYKYQLTRDFTADLEAFMPLPAKIVFDVITEWILLTSAGLLHLRRGYAWDGCSGPTHDDDTNMRGGLIHDAGYQLLRAGLLPAEWKAYFDELLTVVCRADGMNAFRAWYYKKAVELFGNDAAERDSDPYPELTAPGGMT